jgi:hypothetical protein
VSDEGKKFLKNRETLTLPEIISRREKKEKKSAEQNINYDIGLFDELRLLRKRIAELTSGLLFDAGEERVHVQMSDQALRFSEDHKGVKEK